MSESKKPEAEPTAAGGAMGIFLLGGFIGFIGGVLSETVSKRGEWVFEHPLLFGAIVGVVATHLLLLASIAVRLWTPPPPKNTTPSEN